MSDSKSTLETYSNLKGSLISSIHEMLAIESIRGCPCEELKEKSEKNIFNLVVVGQFKRVRRAL